MGKIKPDEKSILRIFKADIAKAKENLVEQFRKRVITLYRDRTISKDTYNAMRSHLRDNLE